MFEHVAETPSYASLAYYLYALLVRPHSPHRPTSHTRCSSALVPLAGLHLVCVTHLASFSSLAYISYALLVCHHSPHWPTSRTLCSFGLLFAHLHLNVWQKRCAMHHWPTTCRRCSSALILLAGLHLIHIARRHSFSSAAYCPYRLLFCTYSARAPTSHTHCSSGLILLADLLLIQVARLPSFTTLAYFSYVSLIWPPFC